MSCAGKYALVLLAFGIIVTAGIGLVSEHVDSIWGYCLKWIALFVLLFSAVFAELLYRDFNDACPEEKEELRLEANEKFKSGYELCAASIKEDIDRKLKKLCREVERAE